MAQWLLDRVPWYKFGTVVISLPIIGLFFCVVYSLLFDFEETTRTPGCGAFNFLPSISAASGQKEPQISVWWWCIVLHTPGRYFISVSYLYFYGTLPSAEWRQLNGPTAVVCVLINIIEVTSLLTLTLYSSSYNFQVHSTSFGAFIVCSMVYMLLVISLHKSLNKDSGSLQLSSSIKCKRYLLIVYFVSVATAMYLYWRHQTYCETGVYSFFGLFEYLVVLTNISFHATFMKDFTSHVYTSQSLTV